MMMKRCVVIFVVVACMSMDLCKKNVYNLPLRKIQFTSKLKLEPECFIHFTSRHALSSWVRSAAIPHVVLWINKKYKFFVSSLSLGHDDKMAQPLTRSKFKAKQNSPSMRAFKCHKNIFHIVQRWKKMRKVYIHIIYFEWSRDEKKALFNHWYISTTCGRGKTNERNFRSQNFTSFSTRVALHPMSYYAERKIF